MFAGRDLKINLNGKTREEQRLGSGASEEWCLEGWPLGQHPVPPSLADWRASTGPWGEGVPSGKPGAGPGHCEGTGNEPHVALSHRRSLAERTSHRCLVTPPSVCPPVCLSLPHTADPAWPIRSAKVCGMSVFCLGHCLSLAPGPGGEGGPGQSRGVRGPPPAPCRAWLFCLTCAGLCRQQLSSGNYVAQQPETGQDVRAPGPVGLDSQNRGPSASGHGEGRVPACGSSSQAWAAPPPSQALQGPQIPREARRPGQASSWAGGEGAFGAGPL